MRILLYKIIFSFLLFLSIWLTGLIWFIAKVPTSPANNSTVTDAIVVLTGGSNRIEYGLQQLSDGMSNTLLITGVHENISTEQLITRNAAPAIRDHLLGMSKRSIILGHVAENTIGNAEETKEWAEKLHWKSIRLVTSNYHMPRSYEEFSKTLPHMTIIQTPVTPDDFSMNNWWSVPESRLLMLSEYHKYLACIARHYLIEKLK